MRKKESIKITEKPSRVPDLFELQRDSTLKDYIEEVSHLGSESAIVQRFLLLLKDVFGEINSNFVEDYLQGVEKYVKVRKKDFLLRGRIDNLYGNLVIEFESDLGKKLLEAEGQLKRYVACLWSEEEEKREASSLPVTPKRLERRLQRYSPWR